MASIDAESDYLTGDDMVAYFIAGMDGASEGATYATTDVSREALLARNREVFAGVSPARGALIDANALYGQDARDLERAGVIVVNHASRFLTYALTDVGAEMVAGVR